MGGRTSGACENCHARLNGMPGKKWVNIKISIHNDWVPTYLIFTDDKLDNVIKKPQIGKSGDLWLAYDDTLKTGLSQAKFDQNQAGVNGGKCTYLSVLASLGTR
jgi:hypothetical protein